MSNLAEAKKLQEEEDSGQWEGLPASTEPPGARRPSVGSLEEKKKQLEDAESTARHWIGQTSRTMRFLAYVTEGCCEPFLAGVFVQRMAQSKPTTSNPPSLVVYGMGLCLRACV